MDVSSVLLCVVAHITWALVPPVGGYRPRHERLVMPKRRQQMMMGSGTTALSTSGTALGSTTPNQGRNEWKD